MFHQFQRQQREISSADCKIIQNAFDLADLEKKGYLNRDDFKIAHIAIFGCKPSTYEIQEIMTKYGQLISKPGSEREEIHVLDFEKYRYIMLDRLRATDINDEIRETFHLLDARCKGFVDFEDFKKLVHRFLPHFDLSNIRRIFNETDGDSDGRVSFRDFQMLMNSDLYKV